MSVSAKNITFAFVTQTSGFFISPAGSVSSRFSDITELSSGGFSTLLRAKCDGQWWTLKSLAPSACQNPMYSHLLQKEYDILSRLSHPGIVRVEGIEVVEGYGECIVMEWIDGVTLSEWLSQSHTLAERKRVARQLLDVLEYVHKHQIVHRDLKPSNIMVTRNGSMVKLIDFGLSDADNYAILKEPAGTEGYVSPEQQKGGPTDVRNDIYSLGVILQGMNLGWNWRWAIRHCLCPLEKRFTCVSDMQHALKVLRHRVQTGILLACMLVVCTLGVVGYNKMKSPDTVYDAVAHFHVGNLVYTSWGGGVVSVKAANDKDSCIEIPASVTYRGVSYQVDEVEDSAFASHKILRWLVFPDNPHLHVMKHILDGSPRVESICFRSKVPPLLGNAIWPVKMKEVAANSLFETLRLYVPKGSLESYRRSPWGRFVHIEEYD